MSLADSAVAAASSADALIVLTEWDEFTKLDANQILSAMSGKVVVDTRNVLDKTKWEVAGAEFPTSSNSRAV